MRLRISVIIIKEKMINPTNKDKTRLKQISRQKSNRPTGSAIEADYSDDIIRLAQFIMIWLAPKILVSYYIRKSDIRVQLSDLDQDKNYILAPNHQSMLDPFLISSVLPINIWGRLAPIRSFAHTIFFTRWTTYPWMIAMGCFPARQHSHLPYGLELAERLLTKGHTIAIFPEGQRAIPGEVFAKHGVAVLSRIPNVRVIPVHIQWTPGNLLQRRAVLTIGKPQDYSHLTAQEILQEIYKLPLPADSGRK